MKTAREMNETLSDITVHDMSLHYAMKIARINGFDPAAITSLMVATVDGEVVVSAQVVGK